MASWSWKRIGINSSEEKGNETEVFSWLVQVTEEAINEMKEAKESIDWNELRKEERKLKHDVMAHNHVYGRVSESMTEHVNNYL